MTSDLSASAKRETNMQNDEHNFWKSVGHIFVRMSGLGLLAICFIPQAWLGFNVEAAAQIKTWIGWGRNLLSLGALALVALFALSLLPQPNLLSKLGDFFRRRATLTLLLELAILGIFLALALNFAFEFKPHLVDSIVQLFQAKIFASAAVTAPAPKHPAFFVMQHLLLDNGRLYSQYPPGLPLLLALGIKVGAAWIVNPLLTLLTALLLFKFLANAFNQSTARLGILLCAFCPLLFFMGASYMNHLPALLGVTGFIFCYERWETLDRKIWVVLAACSLGLTFICRPLDALAFGLLYAGFTLYSSALRRRYADLALGSLIFLAWVGLAALYNYGTTGDPLLPGYIKLWGANHGLGFHLTPWGELHTPLRGIKAQLRNLYLMQRLLFEWPLPGLLPLALLLIFKRRVSLWERRLLFSSLVLPLVYICYWHNDEYLGPRFLFSSIGCLIALTALSFQHVFTCLKERDYKFLHVNLKLELLPGIVLALLVTSALLNNIPARFFQYGHSLESLKLDLNERARQQGISQALIFVAVSWGGRLISNLRELNVPASLVERAYRNIDHCYLSELVNQGLTKELSNEELLAALRLALEERTPLIKPNLTQDPTLRLSPTRPLTRACIDEINYDRRGFSVYEAQLNYNNPTFDGPLIFARDLRERNQLLLEQYSNRSAYLWKGGELKRIN